MTLNVELITETVVVGDTTAPTLFSVRADPAGQTSLSWSTDVSENGATVFARARLATAPALSKSDIETGTGDAVGSLGQAVSAAGAASSGQIASLTAGTSYIVDMFARDAAGNESPGIFSAPATSTTAPGGSITVTINMMDQSALGIAPEGVFLEARFADADVPEDLNRLNYDPSFHRSRVRWTFTKQGETYAAQASDKVVNLPAAFNDTNTAYGKRVGHVFTEPGTWIIAVEVQDFSGNVGTAQMTHTVGDPETAFPGNRTICVGSGTGAPAGAQTVASIPAAITAMQNLGQTGRILLERGQTYTEQLLDLRNSASNWYISAYGTGAKPIVLGTGRASGGQSIFTNQSENRDIIFDGVQLQGPWDATTETGNIIKGYRRPADGGSERTYELFNDCAFVALEIGIDFGKQDAGLNSSAFKGEYVHNCDFPSYQDMQLFHASAPNSYLSVTGSRLMQDPNALMGQNGKYGSPRYNQHTPHRAAHAGIATMPSASSSRATTGRKTPNPARNRHCGGTRAENQGPPRWLSGITSKAGAAISTWRTPRAPQIAPPTTCLSNAT